MSNPRHRKNSKLPCKRTFKEVALKPYKVAHLQIVFPAANRILRKSSTMQQPFLNGSVAKQMHSG